MSFPKGHPGDVEALFPREVVLADYEAVGYAPVVQPRPHEVHVAVARALRHHVGLPFRHGWGAGKRRVAHGHHEGRGRYLGGGLGAKREGAHCCWCSALPGGCQLFVPDRWWFAPCRGTLARVAKLGWVFGSEACGQFDARDALFAEFHAKVRRVACGPPTVLCACPVAKTLLGYDASPVLRQFARETALDVVDLWDPPPAILHYLRTGDESARAAARAARSISGASITATAAVWALAYVAPQASARGAAQEAAWAATTRFTEEAARIAARAAAKRRLARLLIAGRRVYGQRAVF